MNLKTAIWTIFPWLYFCTHLSYYCASAAVEVYAIVMRLSVCPLVRLSICLSQISVLLKWLNIGTRKQHHTIAQGL